MRGVANLRVVAGRTRELGRYGSAAGERVLYAVLCADCGSWSVIDAAADSEGQSEACLVEPRVDSLDQAEALGRDYLPRARRVRRPLPISTATGLDAERIRRQGIGR